MIKVLSIANQEITNQAKASFSQWLPEHNFNIQSFSLQYKIAETTVKRILKETGAKVNPDPLLRIFLATGIESLCPEIITMEPVDPEDVGKNQENYLAFLDQIAGAVTTKAMLAKKMGCSRTVFGYLSNEKNAVEKQHYRIEFITAMRKKVAAKFNEILLEKADQDAPIIAQIESVLRGEKAGQLIDKEVVSVRAKKKTVTKAVDQQTGIKQLAGEVSPLGVKYVLGPEFFQAIEVAKLASFQGAEDLAQLTKSQLELARALLNICTQIKDTKIRQKIQKLLGREVEELHLAIRLFTVENPNGLTPIFQAQRETWFRDQLRENGKGREK